MSMSNKNIRHLTERLLSRSEAAEFLGVSSKTLANWYSEDRYALPTIKIGRLVKYRVTVLQDFIEDRTRYPINKSDNGQNH
jgi:DNA-binding XRE family transcriptional regulator